MGSALDTFGSFIIGGVVLVMLTALVIRMQQSASDTVLNEISQVSLTDMTQTLERELGIIGYRVPSSQKILAMSNTSITFLSDLGNDGVVDTVSYATNTTNLGQEVTRTVARSGARARSWTSKGCLLLFTGYDSARAATLTAANVRSIEASMLSSNLLVRSEDVGASRVLSGTPLTRTIGSQQVVDHNVIMRSAVNCNTGAYWHKQVFPRNLSVAAVQ